MGGGKKPPTRELEILRFWTRGLLRSDSVRPQTFGVDFFQLDPNDPQAQLLPKSTTWKSGSLKDNGWTDGGGVMMGKRKDTASTHPPIRGSLGKPASSLIPSWW